MNYNQLRDYLKVVSDLEEEIYRHQKIKKAMESKIGQLGIPILIQKPILIPEQTEKLKGGKIALGMSTICIVVLLLVIIGFDENQDAIFSWHPLLALPIALAVLAAFIAVIPAGLAVVGSFFAVIIDFFRNIIHGRHHKFEANKTNTEHVNLYRVACANEAHRITNEQNLKNNLLEKNMEISSMICRLTDQLNELYQQNIVFEAYRTMPIIMQLYQYIASRMCDRLEGANGAYAMYHTDVGRICIQLERIEARLVNIQANQQILYQAVNKTNQLLGRVNDELGMLNSAALQAIGTLERQVNLQCDANRYLSDFGPKLANISNDVDHIKMNQSIQTLNDYRAITERGVSNYKLSYPQ